MEQQYYLSTKLSEIVKEIAFIKPELALIIGLLLVLIVGLFTENKFLLTGLSIVTLLFTAFYIGDFLLSDSAKVSVYNGMITQTRISSYFKLLFIFAGIITLLFTNFSYRDKNEVEGNLEYNILLLGSVLGLNLMAISTNLLMLFIAIETVSLTAYCLVLFKNDKRSKESGIKYLIYGLFITGFMLYGASLLYITKGSLDYQVLVNNIQGDQGILFLIGSFFFLTGAFFKLSLAPFHIWAPDVYEGSPIPVVAYLSVAPKLGGLIALSVFTCLVINVELIAGWSWKEILAILSILTMIIGNFSALFQSNIKRLLAYSSIAHAGFLLIGFVAFNDFGIQSLLFYSLIYLLMNFSAFILVDILTKKVNSELIKDFAGLGLKMPLIGVLFVVVVLALIGLPPTAGFSAKLFVFTALWDTAQKEANEIFYYLFIIGLFNVVIALFYYIKIPFYLFFRKEEKESGAVDMTIYHKIVLFTLTLPLVILFISPNTVLEMFDYINNLANNYFL